MLNKKSIVVRAIDCDYGVVEPNAILGELVRNCKFYSPWSKIIKRELLESNGIRFNTNMIYGEDAVFNIELLNCNPIVFYVDKTFYLYNYVFCTLASRWKNKTSKMINFGNNTDNWRN